MKKTIIHILHHPKNDFEGIKMQFDPLCYECIGFTQLNELYAFALESAPALVLVWPNAVDPEDASRAEKYWEQFVERGIPVWHIGMGGFASTPYSGVQRSHLWEEMLEKSGSMAPMNRYFSVYEWQHGGGVDGKEPNALHQKEERVSFEKQAFSAMANEMDEYERRLRNAFYCTRLELLRRQSSRSRILENLLPTSLNSIRRIVEQEAMKGNPHSVHFFFEEGLYLINDHHLERLIQELLENAFRFSDPNSRIEVGWVMEGHSAILTIYNTGQGIDAESLEKLNLKINEQFPVRYNDQWGLRIAVKIAQLYQASVSIISEPNYFFSISMTFPNVTVHDHKVRHAAVTGAPFPQAQAPEMAME
jgi:hypothetical protein